MHTLDRQIRLTSGVFSAGATTWTLPYSVATDGSQGVLRVVRASDSTVLTTTRPTATTIRAVGDFSTTVVLIGIEYTASLTLSTIYARDPQQNDRPVTNRRLNLQRLFVEHSEMPGAMTVAVARTGYGTQTLPKGTAAEGFLRVPVCGRADACTITINISSLRGGRLTNIEWEGFLH